MNLVPNLENCAVQNVNSDLVSFLHLLYIAPQQLRHLQSHPSTAVQPPMVQQGPLARTVGAANSPVCLAVRQL